jgi:hypothetical protein
MGHHPQARDNPILTPPGFERNVVVPDDRVAFD